MERSLFVFWIVPATVEVMDVLCGCVWVPWPLCEGI